MLRRSGATVAFQLFADSSVQLLQHPSLRCCTRRPLSVASAPFWRLGSFRSPRYSFDSSPHSICWPSSLPPALVPLAPVLFLSPTLPPSPRHFFFLPLATALSLSPRRSLCSLQCQFLRPALFQSPSVPHVAPALSSSPQHSSRLLRRSFCLPWRSLRRLGPFPVAPAFFPLVPARCLLRTSTRSRHSAFTVSSLTSNHGATLLAAAAPLALTCFPILSPRLSHQFAGRSLAVAPLGAHLSTFRSSLPLLR